MPLRGSPFCCAKGAHPVAWQSQFHGCPDGFASLAGRMTLMSRHHCAKT